MGLAILGGLIGSLHLYQHRYSPHPELVSKLLHIGMGLVTLTFPRLFSSPLPVALMWGLTLHLDFLSTHIPLLLLTNTGRAETLLISQMLGLLAMLLKAIAWQGFDNQFVNYKQNFPPRKITVSLTWRGLWRF